MNLYGYVRTNMGMTTARLRPDANYCWQGLAADMRNV
jgi:hypothetical protein